MTISIQGLQKAFGEGSKQVRALADLDLEIQEGEFCCVVGPSGCGKSTLLDILAGLTRPTAGEVFLGGESITKPHPSVGVVFQDDSTLPWRTVTENVTFGLEVDGFGKKERLDRAREMIDVVGLAGFADYYPHQLSGGMRQRVAIARTLAMGPRVVLLDEPFGALDEQTRLLLGEELLRIWDRTGATAVFITHSISEAAMLSDRVVVMTGRPGTVEDVVEVDLERPRDSGIISSPEFGSITGRIWCLLREQSLKVQAEARDVPV